MGKEDADGPIRGLYGNEAEDGAMGGGGEGAGCRLYACSAADGGAAPGDMFNGGAAALGDTTLLGELVGGGWYDCCGEAG